MKYFALSFLLLAACVSPGFAQATRPAWDSVALPEIVGIVPLEGKGESLAVSFTLEIGPKGADSASVDMLDASGSVVETARVGRSSKAVKSVEFLPPGSGSYSFVVTGARRNESAVISSPVMRYDFVLPLAVSAPTIRNVGGGAVTVGWKAVREASAYRVVFRDGDAVAYDSGPVQTTELRVDGLKVGTRYLVSLAAMRGAESRETAAVPKTVLREADREWRFTWFGQSTNGSRNTFEMLDPDKPEFRLRSCTFFPNGDIDQKAGKFTTFHDGISFYYTVINPKTENFSLTAVFTVDYVNPVADGQEGFGLLALDSLGSDGVSSVNHYTNSAGIIATKFEETLGGVKKTSKDTLGARFVTGITRDVLALGDAGIAQNAVNVARAFSYSPSDLIRTGDTWRITLKKDNTGYRAILEKEYAGADEITEYTLYGTEKLLQLDPDHIYLGFAVARGCNATVSDVRFTVTDPRTDPPAEEEPPELVPLVAKVDSPTTATAIRYPFVFRGNADGTLSVRDVRGKDFLKNARVSADRDFTADFTLGRGVNDFIVTFTPDPGYAPGPKQALARFDRELNRYVQGVVPLSISHTVILNSYEARELYVTPDGSFLGKGTKESPLDLTTALSFAKPGQPVLLAGGEYYLTRPLIIERGRDGSKNAPMELRSLPGERAILDFSAASGGMTLWGNWWKVDGIDIRKTRDNVKGLQVAGNDNVISRVKTYDCGDTGLQISGTSAEPPSMWPVRNLILGCESFNNKDPAENNADGFAAKLTCGEGNAFRYCVAYSNIDDGWDLFSKIESGPIGAVTIDSCVAFKNGSMLDGSGNGDGNGFKMGGDGIAVSHVLRNSVAFSNGASGITSNSNPALIIENCTSWGNGLANVNLYGKGSGARLYKAKNCVSLSGGSKDVFDAATGILSPDNYFWNGVRSENSLGRSLGKDIFKAVYAGVKPVIRDDGTIDMKGMFAPAPGMPEGVGANIK